MRFLSGAHEVLDCVVERLLGIWVVRFGLVELGHWLVGPSSLLLADSVKELRPVGIESSYHRLGS